MKYDLTDEIVSPEFYFRLKINDYDNMKIQIIDIINKIIEELKLNKEFIIKKRNIEKQVNINSEVKSK